MANETTGRDSDKFMLRLPDGMRDRIKSAAEQNNRSMNAEIVATLEQKYPAPDPQNEALIVAAFRDYVSKYYTGDNEKDGIIAQVVIEKMLGAARNLALYDEDTGTLSKTKLTEEIRKEVERRLSTTP